VFGHTLVRASGEANEFLSCDSIDFSGQKDFAKIFMLKNPFLNTFPIQIKTLSFHP